MANKILSINCEKGNGDELWRQIAIGIIRLCFWVE